MWHSRLVVASEYEMVAETVLNLLPIIVMADPCMAGVEVRIQRVEMQGVCEILIGNTAPIS